MACPPERRAPTGILRRGSAAEGDRPLSPPAATATTGGQRERLPAARLPAIMAGVCKQFFDLTRKTSMEDFTIFDNISTLLAYSHHSRSSSGDLFAYVVAAICAAVAAIYRKIRKSATARMAGLTLTVDETTVEPGQELAVAVELVPKKDFHIKRAVVQLVRVETYIDQVTRRRRTSYHEKTKKKVAAEKVIVEGEEAREKRSVAADVRLAVPWDALPTLQGRAVRRKTPGVSWKVVVKFDVPNKFDPSEEQDIVVSNPSSMSAAPPRPTVAESNSSVCSLTLLLDSADVHQGRGVAGVFRVQMHKEADISRVLVKLEGIEKFGDVSDTADIDSMELPQHTPMQAGRVYDWPFQFKTSEDTIPSMRLDKSKVEYAVTGKLDRSMRRDPTVSQEVNILPSCAGDSHAGIGSPAAAAPAAGYSRLR